MTEPTHPADSDGSAFSPDSDGSGLPLSGRLEVRLDAGLDERQRDGKGRYVTDPETARRDAHAAELRAKGWSYRRIGEELGLSTSASHEAVQRALDAIRVEGSAELVALELARLDHMTMRAWAAMECEHLLTLNGKVVVHDGAPLTDVGPNLQAIDRLIRIAERRAKLLGLDAEQKVSVSGAVRYEVVGLSSEEL